MFFLMSGLATAGTHHKRKHPKPKPTPTKSVQNLRPEDLQWLIQ
jgi:hypothetical protein